MTVALIVFVVLLFTGLPLFVNLGLTSFLYIFMTGQNPMVVVQRITQASNSFTMLAAPFFILMGNFMNTSGGPVSKLCRKEHVSPAELLVIHDEVDLAEGEVRAKFGGGLNAHNGLRSLKDKLGTADFSRIRFGVGRPQGKMDVATYVLRELKGAYLESFEVTAQVAADLVEKCIESGVASQL